MEPPEVSRVTEDGSDVDVPSIRRSITAELLSVDLSVSARYLTEFAQEIEDFTEAMTAARVELERLFLEIEAERESCIRRQHRALRHRSTRTVDEITFVGSHARRWGT